MHRFWLPALAACLFSGCVATTENRSASLMVPASFLSNETSEAFEPHGEERTPPRFAERPPPPPLPTPTSPLETTPVVQQPIDPPPVVVPAQFTPAAQLPSADPPAITILRAYLEQNPNSESARKVFQRLRDTDRKVLDALLPMIKDACTDGLDVDLVLNSLELLEERLRPRQLTLSKVCFTRSIESFGVFDPLPASEEGPVYRGGIDGRPGERVQVYVEVHNFANRKIGPCYETALATRLEIRDSAGRPVQFHGVRGDLVQRLDRPARPDRSLSPRQDYYLPVQFHIPPHLPAGRYDLCIEVCDEAASTPGARRLDSRVLPFRVEAVR